MIDISKNNLANDPSPYLQQHKSNPVNWQIWSSEVIKGVFGPVAGAVDQTHQAFLEASSVGANFGGNMKDLLTASGEAGLSLSEYTGIIKGNSEALMFLGGSVDEGAKRLAKLGKDIRNTPLAADLARLGFSTTDINEGFADYSKMLAKNGRLQGKTDADLIDACGQQA